VSPLLTGLLKNTNVMMEVQAAQVRKPPSFEPFYAKTMILPRQARDKHRGN
jgi:hypothetical protein